MDYRSSVPFDARLTKDSFEQYLVISQQLWETNEGGVREYALRQFVDGLAEKGISAEPSDVRASVYPHPAEEKLILTWQPQLSVFCGSSGIEEIRTMTNDEGIMMRSVNRVASPHSRTTFNELDDIVPVQPGLEHLTFDWVGNSMTYGRAYFVQI